MTELEEMEKRILEQIEERQKAIIAYYFPPENQLLAIRQYPSSVVIDCQRALLEDTLLQGLRERLVEILRNKPIVVIVSDRFKCQKIKAQYICLQESLVD